LRRIALGAADIGEREKQYVNDVLNSNRLSAGKYTRDFEQAVARHHDCRYGIACNSGTSALQIALAALKEVHGWSEGDEVLVPAITFIATSNIVLYNQLVPRFVDVDPRTYNINPAQIEAALSERTRAIIPVHLFGLPCDMDPILALADRHRLAILEDSCETMFARYRGRSVGSFGAMACFSTYVAHLLVTGVGGLVTTNDEEYATLCRSLLAHGRDSIYLNIDDDDDVSGDALERIVARRFSFVRLGFSYRMTELEAALGVGQVERKDEIITARRRNAATLNALLAPLEQYLQLPSVPPDREHSFMLYPLVIRDSWDCSDLVNFLEARGVETRFMFPLLNQPIYRKLFGKIEDRYPVAYRLSRSGFYIGCHHLLTSEDLEYVAEVLREYFRRS
jgi:dTDP-4-amino-4,6-dideoxygalactose transaminase